MEGGLGKRTVRLLNPKPDTIVAPGANFHFAVPWSAENAPPIARVNHAIQEQGNAFADVWFKK